MKGTRHLTDATPIPPPVTPDEIRQQRLERQRQQRVLQLEDQLDSARQRVEQCRTRLDDALKRQASLEAEIAELRAKAPPGDEGP